MQSRKGVRESETEFRTRENKKCGNSIWDESTQQFMKKEIAEEEERFVRFSEHVNDF